MHIHINTCIMNPLITLWKLLPLYDLGTPNAVTPEEGEKR